MPIVHIAVAGLAIDDVSCEGPASFAAMLALPQREVVFKKRHVLLGRGLWIPGVSTPTMLGLPSIFKWWGSRRSLTSPRGSPKRLRWRNRLPLRTLVLLLLARLEFLAAALLDAVHTMPQIRKYAPPTRRRRNYGVIATTGTRSRGAVRARCATSTSRKRMR